MSYKSAQIAVLEGKWFEDRHVSVRDLLLPLFQIWSNGANHLLHYEMFTTSNAFRAALTHSFQKGKAPVLYIAAHGSTNKIHGFHDDGIPISSIKKHLSGIGGSSARKGLFFGACDFGSKKNAGYIFTHAPAVKWVAGYTTSVDWIDSSVLDMYFLRHYLFPAPGKGNAKPKTSLERAKYACGRVMSDMGPMAIRLGFHLFIRSKSSKPMDYVAALENQLGPSGE